MITGDECSRFNSNCSINDETWKLIVADYNHAV